MAMLLSWKESGGGCIGIDGELETGRGGGMRDKANDKRIRT